MSHENFVTIQTRSGNYYINKSTFFSRNTLTITVPPVSIYNQNQPNKKLHGELIHGLPNEYRTNENLYPR